MNYLDIYLFFKVVIYNFIDYIMQWIIFWINLFIFIILFVFVNWRLNKISQEINNIVQSKILFNEEKRLKKLIIILFIFFFMIANIYIFIYF